MKTALLKGARGRLAWRKIVRNRGKRRITNDNDNNKQHTEYDKQH